MTLLTQRNEILLLTAVLLFSCMALYVKQNNMPNQPKYFNTPSHEYAISSKHFPTPDASLIYEGEAMRSMYKNEALPSHTCSALSSFPFPASVQQFQCTEFFHSVANETELKRALRYRRNLDGIGISGYKNLTENCTDYVWRRGYILEPVNEEEARFSLAFSILIYRDVEQVERLLRTVYRPQNYYCIHVDERSTDVYETVSLIARCLPNVFMSEVRYQVVWGTSSILMPEIQCMKQLLAFKWRYLINLTGMEFPLKTNWEMVQILRVVNGGNLISGDFHGVFAHRWKNRWENLVNVGKYEIFPPQNISIAKGFVYMAATWDFVNFTIRSDVGKQFLEWVKPTQIPEEIYFPSLNLNPKIGAPGAFTGGREEANKLPQVMKHVTWGRVPGCPHVTINRHGVCVINVGMLSGLDSSSQLVVNKFLYQPDQVLAYDCMEELIIKRVQKEYCEKHRLSQSSLLYYRRLGYSRKHLPSPSVQNQ